MESAPVGITPVQKRLAPEGVYYVLQRLSVTTDSGVASVTPGGKVTLVRAGSPMCVTDGEHQYDANSSQLTNDIDLAEKLARDDHSAQAKLLQPVAQAIPGQRPPQQQKQPTAQEQPVVTPSQKTPEEISQAETDRQAKIAGIRQKIKDARQAIHDSHPARTGSGRVQVGSQHAQQQLIDSKNKEISDLQSELRKLGAMGIYD